MTVCCVSGHTITFPDFPEHETIWAIAGDDRGRVHVAVCCELTGGGTVQLYCYETATGELHHALDVAVAIGEHPDDGHASHGTILFALCPATDGWVYAATHCTTPPRGDASWDAKAMWGHPQKSFSGGHLFRYRPETGECQDFGILYPNQGIPALILDEGLGRLAGVTYPAARLFVVDADGGSFTDLGRTAHRRRVPALLARRDRAGWPDLCR